MSETRGGFLQSGWQRFKAGKGNFIVTAVTTTGVAVAVGIFAPSSSATLWERVVWWVIGALVGFVVGLLVCLAAFMVINLFTYVGQLERRLGALEARDAQRLEAIRYSLSLQSVTANIAGSSDLRDVALVFVLESGADVPLRCEVVGGSVQIAGVTATTPFSAASGHVLQPGKQLRYTWKAIPSVTRDAVNAGAEARLEVAFGSPSDKPPPIKAGFHIKAVPVVFDPNGWPSNWQWNPVEETTYEVVDDIDHE